MEYTFTAEKKVIKKGLGKGTYYKVLCDGVFYAWLNRKEFNFKKNTPKTLDELFNYK